MCALSLFARPSLLGGGFLFSASLCPVKVWRYGFDFQHLVSTLSYVHRTLLWLIAEDRKCCYKKCKILGSFLSGFVVLSVAKKNTLVTIFRGPVWCSFLWSARCKMRADTWHCLAKSLNSSDTVRTWSQSLIMKRCTLVLSLEEHRYNWETADAGGEQAWQDTYYVAGYKMYKDIIRIYKFRIYVWYIKHDIWLMI